MTDDRETWGDQDHDEPPSLFAEDPEDHQDLRRYPHSRRLTRRGRGLASCLVVLVVLALLGGVAAFAFSSGLDRMKGLFAGPPDYSGNGTGKVVFEVRQGDTSAAIGRNLHDAGVVKSEQAFTDAASKNSASRGIQVGFYDLHKRMSADAALRILVNPKNLVQNTVTIPEGLRLVDILPQLARSTGIPLAKFRSAVKDGRAIGLPSYANGNAEGYLFPATYSFPPNADATSVLKAMVDRWKEAAAQAHLEQRAKALGYTPGQLMTVASLVESEANRQQDRGKVARVIYNRLQTNATGHLLQIDATVNYALGRKLGLGLTPQDLRVNSPYNTRRYPGLPPGPIESPGDKSIAAAAHPTPGNWVYYVTVNLKTGETKFTRSYKQFLAYKQQLDQWCQGSNRC